MKKINNIALSVIILLVLCGPSFMVACDVAGVQLPSWATAEDAKWISGGIKETNVKQNFNIKGFASRVLQDSVEDEIGNRVPCKGAAMLGNAALQRGLISISNSLFSWECYPTFFGSNILYIPSCNAVTHAPKKKGGLDDLMRFGENLGSFASLHPDRRFVVCVVQGYQSPAVNPAYSLSSQVLLPVDQVKAISDGVGASANAFVSTVEYDTLYDYYTDFFKTDHHWNYRGAIKAFNDIARQLDLPAFVSPGEIAFPGYQYTGATARAGLMPLSEEVFDTSLDFSGLQVVSPKGERYSYGHSAFLDNDSAQKKYKFHDWYYDCVTNGSVIEGPGSRKALLISNSYGASILPYIAYNYESTTDLSIIHPNRRNPSDRLEGLLESGEYDDVIFVASPKDIADYEAACPDFFATPAKSSV